jgi:NTE family protein
VRTHAASARRLALLLATLLATGGTAIAQAEAPAPAASAASPVPMPVAASAPTAGLPPPASTTGRRPKVCLVLSGGGARGAAHVGVLRVLEELRVPVDCITGTSMGSIVGGAYASGTPLDQMEKTVDSMSTRLLFTELPPREERAVRLKRDDATILSPLEIGVKGGDVLLPKGLVSGVQLESVLRGLSKVRGYQRFDDLPIPFRAVATDLVTGKAAVLSHGELASAMRASMSVPGAIEPVHLDSSLLVDGGLTDNLPIDVARAMGAEVVIAVNLGTPLMKPEQLNSVLGVTGQMVNILTEQNVRASLASLKPSDILVLPELGDFSAADFDHLPETIPIGEAAARKVADRLAAYAVPQAEYDAWQARRQAGVVAALGTVDEIRFTPQPNVNTEISRAVMKTKPGVPIDQAELDRDMRRIYGTGDFEHVSYQILEEPGKRVLAVDAVEKAWGPNYLRLGLGLSSDFRGDAYFNILGSFRMRWLNELGAEWRNDLQVGRTNRAYTEFYQPIESSQTFFVVPSFELQRRPVDVYDSTQRVARFDIADWAASLEAGAQFTRYGELRLGVTRTDVKTTLDTGSTALVVTNSHENYTLLTMRGLADQVDNVNFPRHGYAGSFEILSARDFLGNDVEWSRGQITGQAFTSWGRNTISAGYKFGGRLGNEPMPPLGYFSWGGLLQQSGYPTGALVGDNIRFGRLMYLRQLKSWSILDGVYGGVSFEVGRVGKPLIENNEQGTLKSMALFLGVDTPIGPFYLGWGRTETGINSAYLYLGRP